MADKKRREFDIKLIEKRFRESESSVGRKGAFKIEAPFEDAIKTILKAKPERKKPARKRKQKHNM